MRNYFNLSNSQKMILESNNLNKKNIQFEFLFPLSDEKFVKQGLDLLINSYLNIQITNLNSTIKQYYSNYISGDYLFKDLSSNSDKDIEEYITDFNSYSFDNLFDESLYRFLIIKTKNDIKVIGNVSSIILNSNYVDKLYFTLNSFIESLKKDINYSDVISPNYEQSIKIEETYLGSDSYTFDEKYWNNQIVDIPIYLYNIPEIKEFNQKKISLELESDLIDKLKALLSNEDNISVLSLFSSLMSIYLSRTRRAEGTIFEIESTSQNITLSNNILAIKIPYDEEKSFQDMLLNTQSQINNSFSHGKFSYDIYKTLLEEKGIDSSSVLTYSIKNINGNSDIDYLSYGLNENNALTLIINNWNLEFIYNSTVYTTVQMENMVDNIHDLLENIVTNKCLCKDLDIVSHKELKVLKEYSKGETIDYDMTKTIVDYIYENGKKYASNYAVEDMENKITYSEFDKYTSSLASYLSDNNVKQHDVVAIMLPRTYINYVASMGIMKLGAIFVPVDPTYPKERIKYILEYSEAKYLLTSEKMYNNDLDVDNLIFIDDLNLKDNKTFEAVDINPEDIAFITFTSGSTGKPKGVMISHRALLACAFTVRTACHTKPGDIVVSYASFSFIVSATMYCAYVIGATCKILDGEIRRNYSELVDYLENTHINNMVLPTNFGVDLYQHYNLKVDYLYLGGEKLKGLDNKRIVEKEDYYLLNGYGSSETCSGVASLQFSSNRIYEDIPIGKPLYNSWAYIVDSNNKPLPIGVPGEIAISGNQISSGYLKKPELTSKVFVDNPFADCEYNKILYHTGDLGYWNEYGEIVIMGRIDDQIKLRGFRIEPGEIEKYILDYPGIKSIAIALKNQNLAAYYLSDVDIDVDDLRSTLEDILPEYMVPTFYVHMNSFPINVNGKVDLNALPNPEIEKSEIIKPTTNLEQRIFDICADILGVNDFGINTNLISLGLNSLSAIKISFQISKEYNVQITVKDINDSKTVEGIVNKLKISSAIKTVHHEKRDLYPLSQNQLGVYFETIKNPKKLIYNIPITVSLGKDIDVDKLKNCIVKLVNKHTYLKSVLIQKDGKIYLKRQDDVDVVVNTHKGICTKEIKEDFVKPFDLFTGPLYRFDIYESEEDVSLLMDTHHIIFDGTSGNIFLDNLIDEYNGINTPVEEYSGFDFILEELETENSTKYQEAEKFFEQKLSEVDSVTSIIPDVNGKKEDGKLEESISKLNKDEIDLFCKNNSITPNNLFLASTLFVLSKFGYTKDMLLSTISNGRVNPHFHDTLAMVVRSLPIITKVDSNLTVQDFLQSVQESFMDTIDNECYPFTKMFEKYGMLPELYYAYQVGLFSEKTIINKNGEENNINAGTVELEVPKFNVCIYIEEDETDIKIIIRYNDQLYSNTLMDKLATSIKLVVNKFKASMSKKISNISLLTDTEEKIYLDQENNFSIKPYQPLLNKVFEEAVDKTPDEIALIATDKILSYDQLNKESNKVANALIKKGISVGDKVLFKLNRTSKLMITLLGIVKSGAAFIPLDPEYPEERINYISKDSESKYIIAESEEKNNYSDKFLDINDLLTETDVSNPNPELNEESLAFLIYTSGSTGKPKGVMIRHSGITNYINSDKENTPIYAIKNEVTRMLSITTVSFIAFLREVLATIVNGVPVVLANEEQSINPIELTKLIKKAGVDGLSGTPSRLQQYLEIGEFASVLDNFKVITIGGEKFPQSLYPLLQEYTHAEIYNSYGPTEVTVASHGKLIDSPIVSEGKPLLNVIDKIVDLDNNPLPPYIIGAISVGGAGVSKGYWHKPELNEKSYSIENGIRYYNTGDLGYKTNTGELFVVGRADAQIKLRGLRIEIGEIESVILENKEINSVAVTVKTIESVEYLCAYYTSNKEIDIEKLRSTISKKLTNYMIPTYYIRMDKFPLNPNGKLDLNKLPLPNIITDKEEIIKPETKLEKEVFDICSDILNKSNFGITTNLFNIGFTSLTVIKLVSEISEKIGVEVNLTNIMKSENIKDIVKEIKSSNKREEFKPHPIQEYYPLTQNQKGVYFDCVRNPEKLIYNEPKYIKFSNINPEKLKQAVLKTIDNHFYIKCKFVKKDGDIYQQRNDKDIIDIPIYEKEFTKEILNEFVRPFDIIDNHLFRFEIYHNQDDTYLLLDFHHIITDGTSMTILVNDILSAYDGKKLQGEIATGYDFALDEKETENSLLYKDSEDYFNDKMKDFDESTVISPDLNRKEEEGKLSLVETFMDKSLIEDFSKKESITPNNLFLGATLLTLSKFVYNKNVLMGMISNGRNRVEYKNTFAMLVKTLAYPIKIDTNVNVKDYLEQVQDTLLDVLDFDSYPFLKISEKYQLNPEFLYAYQSGLTSSVDLSDKDVDVVKIENDSPKVKISLVIEDYEDKFRIIADYNNALYSESLIKTYLESIKTVINTIINNFSIKLKDIALVDENVYPVGNIKLREETLANKVFENVVEEHKTDLALYATDGMFTYDDLNKKANKIANSLIKLGVQIEDRITLVLNRDSDLIATILGVVKSGATFIPLDPEYPKERIDYILDDSDARYIIINDHYLKEGKISEDNLNKCLNINDLLKEVNDTNPTPDLTMDNLSYMIYTSGSTGKPKGVMLTHKGLTNFVYPHKESAMIYGIVKNITNHLCLTTVSFDVFIKEIFVPLLNGLTITLSNENEMNNPLLIAHLIKRAGVEEFGITTSRLIQYLEVDEFKDAMKQIKVTVCGGEAFTPKIYDLMKKCSSAEIYNGYGPTEITVASHSKHMAEGESSVGKTFYNVFDMIADYDGNPVPINVVGELYITGAGLSRGYWNLPNKNKESFVEINGHRYYKTGDYAKKDETGNVTILSRIDNQIKLRGLRIEIGEVENVILEYPNISSVVVMIKKINGSDHLCAYFSSKDKKKINIEDLKNVAKAQLTKYMVPSVFIQLDELPKTPNGKIDRKSLPEPKLAEAEYVKPADDLEKYFADLFAKILDIPKVGATNSFFDLGGTSLLATKIIVEAIKEDYEIYYADLFANQTPRELAKFIRGNKEEEHIDEYKTFDYSEIDSILNQNNLNNFKVGKPNKLGNVLLTGATGFLGIHILKSFIENEEGKIYCMLRKSKSMDIETRLKSLLFYYFENNYEDLFGSRIFMVEGDITKVEDFEKLSDYNIDTLINCAASVKHYASGSQLDKINVGGVVNCIDYCIKNDVQLIQVSTISVAGALKLEDNTEDLIYDEQNLYVNQYLDHKYIYSKYKSEYEVLKAITKGLNGKIMRVGNLMARNADGVFQINFNTNAFITRLKSYNVLGSIPYLALQKSVDLSPIDSTAKAILMLSKTPKECTVFHPYNNHKVFLYDVISDMNELGLNIKGVEYPEFEKLMNNLLSNDSESEELSQIITTLKERGSADVTMTPLSNIYTTDILYRLGFKWSLIDDIYLRNFLEFLKDMDFLEL